MLLLIVGLILFFGVHLVSVVALPWRDATIARIGDGRWKAGYSLVAGAGLACIVWGYARARYAPTLVYFPPIGLQSLAPLLMLPVFPLLIAAYIPGKIRAKLKHPMLFAVQLWALAHLFSNGMLADILLFGSFLVWAVVVRISLERRPPRPTPTLRHSRFNDASAIIVGVIVFLAFVLVLHRLLIGVSPLV